MRQLVNINGFETYIDIPESEVISPVRAEGDKTNYTIRYGNNVVEVGGIVTVEAGIVTDGIVEGTKNIPLPFRQVLDFQATAMNVISDPASLTGESCFITEIEGGFKVYATAKSTETRQIPVKWSAKGII